MTEINYDAAPFAVRADLTAAHARAWHRLARAGAWFTGAERVAIAAEVRNATACPLCRERKAALSPYAVDGEHQSLGALGAPIVEVIHRVRTDPGRLTRAWFDGVRADGLSDGAYVEIIGVLATVVAMDTFARGIGVEPLPLPRAMDGAPTNYRPAGVKQGPAWVPWIAPEDAGDAEADLYGGSTGAHIRRALSLVPDEVRGFFDLVETQYLPGPAMRDFDREFRAIDHAQIELIAGRVSALNGCVY